jgi:DNA-binding winged helix-turn-helix (wHTH) protein/TolB-like protein
MEVVPMAVAVFRFGEFTLDAEGDLRRLDERIPLQEKPRQLLALFVESSGQLVTREEIRRRLWGADTFVEFDDNLNHAVRKLREALGDSAVDPSFIKTVPKQGYRFVAPVHKEYALPDEDTAGIGSAQAPARFATANAGNDQKRMQRLLIGVAALLLAVAGVIVAAFSRDDSASVPSSLLVLPFQSVDASGQDHGMGQGITEQVTAKLMNLHGLRMISPEAAYRVNSAGASPVEAGRRLNAEAVLVGSVRMSENRIRVNAQLIRTADSRIVWAGGGVEVDARDLLEAERVLAAAIAARLTGALTSEERSAMERTPTSNAEAYELFVRGKLAMRNSLRQQDLHLAEQLFTRAVRIEPAFPEARAWLALAQARSFGRGLASDEVRRASIENARKAIAMDPGVAVARLALITIFHTTGQAEEGLEEAAILRKLGAADAVSLSAIAEAYLRAGMPQRAVPIYQQALARDPEDPALADQLAFTAFWARQYQLGLRVLDGQSLEAGLLLPGLNLAVATGQREMLRAMRARVVEDRNVGLINIAYSGLIFRDGGDWELVRRAVRKKIPVYERQAASLRNERLRIGLGLIYSLLGDKLRAQEQARLALDINPGDPWTLFHSGEIHARTGDDRQAIAYVRQAIARGFLAQHYLDWPHFSLYRLRRHPQLRMLRETLASKIAVLAEKY